LGLALSHKEKLTEVTDYFFRAYALEPSNPIVQLSIGLAYIHHGLKRQSENRQHNILQGISFMTLYYQSRKHAKNMEERQECHFNMGRMYHMLGLAHLAIPYYQLVLEETSEQGGSGREDLVVDTAYNLQTIYMAAGNMALAKEITRKCLRV
jgi:general transcription factor 3C polypeptide 3 (transcription factor C subunit 4)